MAILAGCTLFAACSDAPQGQDPDANEQGTEELAASTDDHATRSNIGPVEYGFAPRLLTRAEVEIGVPPDYRTKVWATKLLARDRAELLGQQRCTYGSSVRVVICTAKLEDGLALALLDRPIDAYRQAFVRSGIPQTRLIPSSLAGISGFDFLSASEQRRIEYSFYPLGDRTLLLARRRTEGGSAIDPALASVIASLRFPDASR